jgi:hypothetical protein
VVETSCCTHEEKLHAIEMALGSRTFSRAEQLRAFLHFVCEAEMQGRGTELNEYMIGVEVLGRPKGYSPVEDSSVRTRAYELRQKLEKLYATELPDEPVRIVVTKGGYLPQYVRAPGKPHVETAVVLPAAEHQEIRRGVPPARRKPATTIGLLLVGAVVGAAIAVVSARQNAAKPAVDPVLLEAWRPMARLDANVLLSVATPLHLVVGPEGHQAYASSTYPAPPEAYPLFRQHRPLSPGTKLGLIFTDNVLGIGTMNAVVTAVNTLKSLGSSYEILPERVATLAALRGRNVMLFGAPVDSEAITRTMEHTPLIVDYEASVKEFVIRDRASGGIIVPQKDSNGDFIDVYGLITVLNTRDSDRGRVGMVVFSGITSAGTHGAAEFFSSPRAMRNLRTVLARDGVTGFPAAYQVVVKCTFSNMLLLSYEYHSHRILQKE